MMILYALLLSATPTASTHTITAKAEDALVSSAITSIAPAENGWGYAKWGMSPAELIQASAQTATETVDAKNQRIRGKRRLATSFGKFNYVPVRIDYYFEYKIEKLVFVLIQPLEKGADCIEFEQSATERFGASLPDDTETAFGAGAAPMRSRKREWDDAGRRNIYNFSSVSFGLRSPSHCQILIKDSSISSEEI